MDNTFLGIIIPALVGLVTGALGSIVAPWATWGVEKMKIKMEQRKQLLKDVREVLVDNNNLSYQSFIQTVAYSQICPYLSKKVIDTLENQGGGNNKIIIKIVVGSGRHSGANNFGPMILDDLSRIEKEWGLL